MKSVMRSVETASTTDDQDAWSRRQPPPRAHPPTPRRDRPSWVWPGADAATLLILAVVIGAVRFGGPTWPTYSGAHAVGAYSVAVTLGVLALWAAGAYDPQPRLGRPSPWPRLAVATSVAAVCGVLVAFGTGRYLMPTLNLAVWTLVAPSVLTLLRSVAERMAPTRAAVVIVGARPDVDRASGHLRWAGILTVGHAEPDGDTHLGVADAVRVHGATDVLVVTGGVAAITPEDLVAARAYGVGVHLRVDARQAALGAGRLRQIRGLPVIRVDGPLLPPSRQRLKRLTDLVLTVAVVPVALPLLAIATIWVRSVAGPGVVLRQVRIGKAGRRFTLYKLRTMDPDAETVSGPVVAARRDARVLPRLGWLRAHRLDELPQLWNVVRGDMSLVGPRPERPEIAVRVAQQIDGWERRHEVPPGVTGLAQVEGDAFTDPEYKLGSDLAYLAGWSPLGDLVILLRTARAVLAPRSSDAG